MGAVVLDPTLVFWETDPRTGEDKKVIIPKVYRDAGVKMTFQVTGIAAGNLLLGMSALKKLEFTQRGGTLLLRQTTN